MKKLTLSIIIVLSFLLIAQANDLLFQCGEKYNQNFNLKLVYINTIFDVKWYELDNDSVQLGAYISDRINYLFWNDEYYSKVISIFGAENITEVLRNLNNEFGPPFRNDKNIFGWLKGNTLILHRRFSYHQSQVEIYCKDMYFKRNDIDINGMMNDNTNPMN